jgi:hypothetical protein
MKLEKTTYNSTYAPDDKYRDCKPWCEEGEYIEQLTS